MAFGLEIGHVESLAADDVGQATFIAVAVGIVVDVFDVGAAEAGMRDDRAGRRELCRATGARVATDADDDGLTDGVGHLRRHGALPDQLVDTCFGGGQFTRDLVGQLEGLTGGPDRFVRFLCVLDLAGVVARGVGKVVAAVAFADDRSRRGDRGVGQRGAVGSHVGDVALFVQRLRVTHGVRRREPQLA